MRHGDCHPSNVFYDEGAQLFTMADVADIDTNPYATDDDDVTYFVKALMTLTDYYGSELLTNCKVNMIAAFLAHEIFVITCNLHWRKMNMIAAFGA